METTSGRISTISQTQEIIAEVELAEQKIKLNSLKTTGLEFKAYLYCQILLIRSIRYIVEVFVYLLAVGF